MNENRSSCSERVACKVISAQLGVGGGEEGALPFLDFIVQNEAGIVFRDWCFGWGEASGMESCLG